MTKWTYFVIFLLDFLRFLSGANVFHCPYGDPPTFDKKLATKPARDDSLPQAVFIYRARDGSSLLWSPLECLRKCQAIKECHSVVVFHHNMECVGLPFVETKSLIVDNDANYFVKMCLHVPDTCQTKLWSTESSYGYRLISQGSSISVVLNVTDEECSQHLLKSSGRNDSIRSSQFQLQQPPSNPFSTPFGDNYQNYPSARGKCTLNSENKFTEPESFRVASGDYWYKENQCVEDLPKQIDRCSYEEYYNQTLKHYDVMIQGISTQECKSRCEQEYQFNCRGFTTVPFERGKSQLFLSLGSDDNTAKTCYLHSEDTLTHGSWLLTKKPESVYYRRVTCLNVSVVCTSTGMSITYRPRSDFRGRIYASGYSETCSVPGQGRGEPTTLHIPFLSPDCGVNQAYALGDGRPSIANKTLMYTLLVIQNNPIIQAQGDRFVRVGCVAPPSLNLTLGADINVGQDSDDKSPEGTGSIPASSIINTTGSVDAPKVRMYIINDPDEGDPTAQVNGGAVSLGETIELRIESEYTKSDIDIHAYHLVASSQLGDSSVLLLDGRGCPTGQVDFPALVHTRLPLDPKYGEKGVRFWSSGTTTPPARVGRDTGRAGLRSSTTGRVGPRVTTASARPRANATGGAVRLSARFRAFRFPNSHVVKFSVMVQFCVGPCEKINCDATKSTAHRNKRDVQSESEFDFGERVFHPVPDAFGVPYENASITFLDKPLVRENPSRNAQIVVASSESNGRVREMCREINDSHESKVPLELSLIVASNDVFSADSLIYGENNKILVAAVEDPRTVRNNMICIHEALFISITIIWLLVQVIILAGCMIVIKRYRTFVEENQFQKNYHSFDNLGFEGVPTTRRVHWPDQNADHFTT